MATTILTTKLYIPPPQPRVIQREHLLARLNQGLYSKLTLVSAPAGFGKTTLISTWLATCERPVAWLSLDAEDGDPTRFLTYLVAALQTVAPEAGEGLMAMLSSPQSPPLDALLTPLVNALVTLPEEVLLVLDDYHVVDSAVVDKALGFLLEHLPPQIHLVMLTREDPPLPLARLRVRGQLTEVRAADLRFTADEAAAFLNTAMGLTLTADEVAALETRTEGWIAGLQLAALSMRGKDDAASFIQSFTGTHHFVLDYLAEEVLQHQPAHIQQFLLQTSILDRFCAPLCDVVLEADTGDMLYELEQANLFLIPLDNQRRWYRYHHLFGDLLRQRLQQSDDVDVPALHSRASVWYEDQNLPLEAFQHAAAAGDLDRAAHLIEGNGMPLYFRGGSKPVLNWFGSLPQQVLAANPVLMVNYAGALMITGTQINGIEEMLQTAENALETRPIDDKTDDLIGHIATIRSMLAGPQYDIATMLEQANRALDHLSEDNVAIRTMVMWSKGLAHQYLGEREAAKRVHSEVVAISQQTHNIMVTIAAQTCLGQVQEGDNQLHRAVESYQGIVDLVGEPPWSVACESFLGLGRIAYQWNNLDDAIHYGQTGRDLGQQIENVDTPVACFVLIAEVQMARGALDDAASSLADGVRYARQNNFEAMLPLVIAAQVRLFLLRGDITAAQHLTTNHDLPASRARVALTQGDTAAALALLEPLLNEMDAKGWHDERLRLRVLLALVYQADNNIDAALDVLETALTLAAPDEMIRVFLDEGAPMQALLNEIATRGVMPNYTQSLLNIFHEAYPDAAKPHPQNQPLIEPLSERELQILGMVADGLSNREISERLFLALDTIKGHNRRIYGKLGVKRRTEAVARARELGLL